MKKIEFQPFYKSIMMEAKKDPSLLYSFDAEELAKKVENEKHDYLENKTASGVRKEIEDELLQISGLDDSTRLVYEEKLRDYMLVTEIYELRKGHYLRYIKKGETKLASGGIFMELKFKSTGVVICILLNMKRLISINMENYTIFQKLSPDEKIILACYDCVAGADASEEGAA